MSLTNKRYTTFSQFWRKVRESRRFKIQQTINPNLTSSQAQYKHSSSQSDTRHSDVQKQRPGKNQWSSSQTNLIFPQQHDFRSPEFQTNGSNSSQDSFQSKTSNRSTKKRNGQWFIVSYDSANKQKHHKSHRMQ